MEIPEPEFLAAATNPLGELFKATFNLSDTSCAFFVWVLPRLADGTEWTPAELLTELSHDTQMGQLIKNRSTLFYHLNSLVKLGILKRGEDNKGRYALNNAPSNGLPWMNHLLFDKDLRKILEDHIAYIYILICCVARLIHGAFPQESPPKILALTTTLFHIARDLSIKDLEGRGVLERQCTDCVYPYHRVEWGPRPPLRSIEELIGPDPIIPEDPSEEVADDPETEPVPAPQTDVLAPPLDTPTSLYEQVRHYIGAAAQTGVAKPQIVDHFQSLGYSGSMTDDVILKLTSHGETRINDGRYILNT